MLHHAGLGGHRPAARYRQKAPHRYDEPSSAVHAGALPCQWPAVGTSGIGSGSASVSARPALCQPCTPSGYQ